LIWHFKEGSRDKFEIFQDATDVRNPCVFIDGDPE